MAVFKMIANPPAELLPQGDAINNQYFTVDTASMDVVHSWLNFNGHILTYAMHEGQVLGFFNVIPLTMECGRLFEHEEIKEEDLRIEHILPHDLLPFAQYAYIAAIAVDHTENYVSRQCSAALIACMADLFLHGYGANLKKIFVNPTTFQGNKLVNRLGLKPIPAYKKSLTENDIYAADMNEETCEKLTYLSQRYARFIGDNPWAKKPPTQEPA